MRGCGWPVDGQVSGKVAAFVLIFCVGSEQTLMGIVNC